MESPWIIWTALICHGASLQTSLPVIDPWVESPRKVDCEGDPARVIRIQEQWPCEECSG